MNRNSITDFCIVFRIQEVRFPLVLIVDRGDEVFALDDDSFHPLLFESSFRDPVWFYFCTLYLGLLI